ncbi:MAG: RNA polymerase sigma factor [Eubacteriales bacterium]
MIVIYSRSTALDIYRQKKRRSNNEIHTVEREDGDEQSIIDVDTNIEKLILSNETAQIISEALLKLDSEFKDVILLKYAHGYKSSKIAELYNISEDNVNTRLNRAKKQLIKIAGRALHDRLYI